MFNINNKRQDQSIQKEIELLQEKLKRLLRDIAKHTFSACTGCPTKNDFPNNPQGQSITSCCNDIVCQYVDEKLKVMGIKVKQTGNPNARFSGKKGCVVPPEFRPVCSVFWCKSKMSEQFMDNPKHYREWKQKVQDIEEIQKKLQRLRMQLGQNYFQANIGF